MKSAIWSVFFVLAVVWLVWVVAPESPCERARRGATPVGAVGDVLRRGLEHWLSATERFELIIFSMEAEDATRRFLAKQFYGALDCSKKGA